MAFDINNFIIDRVRRGTMFDKSTGVANWSLTQITDPTLKITATTEEVTDALGSPIMILDRAKKGEFTASNAIFDLGLAAAQFGTSKEIAATGATITTPKFEEFIVASTTTTITLSEIPVGTTAAEIKYIYALNNDSSLSTKYTLGATASATEFTLDAATKLITLPTGRTASVTFIVMYEYAADAAVSVTNSATNFPTAGKFVLEVLGHNVCDSSVTYYAMIIMPNAKLKSDVDLSFTSTGKHPIDMDCMQDYCDSEKKLFQIIVPDVA